MNFFYNGLEVKPLSRMKGVFGVAILATQGTSCQPYKHRRKTDAVGFPLQRMKDFIDAQSLRFDRLLTQCFSAVIFSRRCFARRAAGVSAKRAATWPSASLAASNCFIS